MGSDDKRRAIGKIISVAADRFVVELHRGNDNFTVVGFDDVHYVARLGSFVAIPVQSDYVIAEVVGLWEKDPSSGRPSQNGSTEFDKASSAKFLDLVPLGMLPQRQEESFRFGISMFPSLYADALYVLDNELDRIFEVSDAVEYVQLKGGQKGSRLKALTIGNSVVFKGYEVKAKVDQLFGGHTAILGNTGSGKSCTVATILQSLFEKEDEFVARAATFVFFDVNGEYRNAFSALPGTINRYYLKVAITPESKPVKPLDKTEETNTFRLPHWFMTVEEWELLLRASEKTQQPVLRAALGLSTLFSIAKGDELKKVKNHIIASCMLSILQSEASSPSKKDRIIATLSTFNTNEMNLKNLGEHLKMDWGTIKGTEPLMKILEGQIQQDIALPTYSHAEFEFETLEKCLDLAILYEEAHGNRQIRDYCAQMLTRFKVIKEREEFAFLRISKDKLRPYERELNLFVENFLALERRKEGILKKSQVIILDMNEAADEVVEIASAVMSRLIFDRLRKAEPRNRLPVHLVLEEAHRYVAERPSRYAIDASLTFERIAKEGRKYGVFLIVASQRPSELSKTVLSQCSNFIVHRIQNPDDLSHIKQMTPYISESVMKRLPSLPKQHALVFGNAVNLPTTFKVRNAQPRPKSDDAEIRELWFIPKDQEVELQIPDAESKVDFLK